jgi:hypothetical protein
MNGPEQVADELRRYLAKIRKDAEELNLMSHYENDAQVRTMLRWIALLEGAWKETEQ